MKVESDGDRHSKAHSAELITDPQERAEAEARNALQQFDAAVEIIDSFLQEPERPFKLRPSALLHLHRVALQGISSFAGNHRPAGIEIEGSAHEPIGAHLVPEALEEMCDYINENWSEKPAVHLAAYAMWRINWIHPFDDGNGRTARMVSYLVLCTRLGCHLPGRYTVPEQIAEDKSPYYKALEEADKAFMAGEVNVKGLEGLLSDMLAKQLVSVYESATSVKTATGLAVPKLH